MAARPSDARNVVVSAPKCSQELSDTTNVDCYLEHHSMIDLEEREVAHTAFSSHGFASEQLVEEIRCTNWMCAQAAGDSRCAPGPCQLLEESIREC